MTYTTSIPVNSINKMNKSPLKYKKLSRNTIPQFSRHRIHLFNDIP